MPIKWIVQRLVRKSGRLNLVLIREAEFPEIWEH